MPAIKPCGLAEGAIVTLKTKTRREQQKLDYKKQPCQGRAVQAGSACDQPCGRNRQYEYRNGERLRQVPRSSAHRSSGGHDEIAGNVGGEDIAEGKEPDEVKPCQR
jgi:hypothetical protein